LRRRFDALRFPRRFDDLGIRRYGFHGLSYEYIAGRLAAMSPAMAAKRTVVAHLGNGASLCALRDGRSIDTTMGLTPLDGLVMGTRCGLIDPGVLLYLLQEQGLSADELQHLLYQESGLLGVSGISADMRTLQASGDAAATEAIDLFTFRVAGQVAGAGELAGRIGLSRLHRRQSANTVAPSGNKSATGCNGSASASTRPRTIVRTNASVELIARLTSWSSPPAKRPRSRAIARRNWPSCKARLDAARARPGLPQKTASGGLI